MSPISLSLPVWEAFRSFTAVKTETMYCITSQSCASEVKVLKYIRKMYWCIKFNAHVQLATYCEADQLVNASVSKLQNKGGGTHGTPTTCKAREGGGWASNSAHEPICLHVPSRLCWLVLQYTVQTTGAVGWTMVFHEFYKTDILNSTGGRHCLPDKISLNTHFQSLAKLLFHEDRLW